MNGTSQNAITSQDYADFLIDFTKAVIPEEELLKYPMEWINEHIAVIHMPVEEMNSDTLQKFGYSAIPKCYGITTYRNESIESAYTVQRFELQDISGNGILVGMVDTGIDYMNPAFLNTGRTSKIRFIWDQTIDSGKQPEGFGYGSEYSKEDIDNALLYENPPDILPSRDDVGEGTAMAAIAAGNESPESAFTGIAVNAGLVVVKLKSAKDYLKDFYGIPGNALCYQQTDIMMGIQYLIRKAEQLQMPIAICLGLSSSQGAHDGQDLMSRYLEECGGHIGVALAAAVGNEGDQELHYFGLKMAQDNYNIAELNVGSEAPDFTMELWTDNQSSFQTDIISPTGDTVVTVDIFLPSSPSISIQYGNTSIDIELFMSEIYSGKKLIMFRFKSMAEGIWRFQIREDEGIVSSFHMWLPIRNFLSGNIYFLNADTNTTISVPGNANRLITVTSYNAVDNTLAPSAGRGFTANNFPKPDIAAPGVNIIVPTLEGGFFPLSGSGLATAFAGGVLAAVLEGGSLLGISGDVNTPVLQFALTYLARRDGNREYPNPDWGYGYII